MSRSPADPSGRSGRSVSIALGLRQTLSLSQQPMHLGRGPVQAFSRLSWTSKCFPFSREKSEPRLFCGPDHGRMGARPVPSAERAVLAPVSASDCTDRQ